MKQVKSTQVRIIAGRWRGSKLPVPTVTGLRPTPDRIRETLFNWLANDCRSAQVLDCFAGSGVLGFETASRGAARVTFIEQNEQGWRNLMVQIQRLQAENIDLHRGNSIELIPQLSPIYDIVFIDPPYARPELRELVIKLLIENQKLADGARIYLEWPLGEQYDLPHSDLVWLKQKKAGQVNYAIAEWRPSR